MAKFGYARVSTGGQNLDRQIDQLNECNVSRSMIDKYMNEYLVGNIKTTKTGAELRIISIEKPTEDAVAVEKNLEDAFLFYFGEKSEEKQDA
jgi:ABC-2 type transport system ATP-binding protein